MSANNRQQKQSETIKQQKSKSGNNFKSKQKRLTFELLVFLVAVVVIARLCDCGGKNKMNGLNGSVAVLTSSTVTTTVADPDATNLSTTKTTNNDTTMEISTSQIVTELHSEDRFLEHEEYSTGKSDRCVYVYQKWSLI